MMPLMRTITNNTFTIVGACVLLMALLLVYSLVSNDYDEEDTVTFTFYCSSVRANKSAYPPEVNDACERQRRTQDAK